ncbi:MAG: hypothetical protein ABI405_00420 [Parafilimonas sp.]
MKNYLTAAFLFLFFRGYSQQLSQVSFTQASVFSWFSLLTNQNILIRISDGGKILEAGTEESSNHYRNYFAPKLLPYAGVINYYEHQHDSTLNGKIKNIGTCYFTYYAASDFPERIGKLKSAGSLSFDYYAKNEDALIGGRIKTIGTTAITYYTSFENEALKGKLSAVGNISIVYYTSFDNQFLKGKLKSIGPYNYKWITRFSGDQFVSYLKTGNQRQLINGITYIPQ